MSLLARLAPNEGYTRSALEGVTFMRSNRALARTPALYEPSIVVVAQGRKRGFHNGETYVYDAQHYLVLATPLPFEIETEASIDTPMLGIALRIDIALIAELALAINKAQLPLTKLARVMFSTPLDSRLSDAVLRLLEALSSPIESQLLAPAILREVMYLVLSSEQAETLRAALAQDGKFLRIAKALRRIHEQYDKRLNVGMLATEACMSIPAFHIHFKGVTASSPIQYIKAMRLHQARLLMIRSGLSAATASVQVGYESASQFNREFKRLFGRSPVEEAHHLKEVLSISPAAG